MSSSSLSEFLSANKAKFLSDLKADGAKSWTVVMGNEAGDLDSIASAIAYSYLTPRKPTIGLIQTHRQDLSLRAENLYAFKLANLSPTHDDLFTIDDLPVPPAELKCNFALVDHNTLWAPWRRPDAKVVGIIDHHDDENNHIDADPRAIVVPLGSAASLVTETFKDSWTPADPANVPPPELATLLLSAIYIDTAGLKSSKAEPLDHASVAFLESRESNNPSLGGEEVSLFRIETTKELKSQKISITHLSSRDLLRRDYKQYTFSTATEGNPIRVGLSTVPMGIKQWLKNDPDGFRASLESWATERTLDVVGVLTTYNSARKGHHRRELLILVGGDPTSAYGQKALVETTTNVLVEGLEKTALLDLERVEFEGDFAAIEGVAGDRAHGDLPGQIRLWRQRNSDATRKIVAPAFKAILESM
ncbi:hypothetical protein BS47DRAFT_1343244 [Hydnum rufescens UP504]|uniref:DHHA2 domain-containing protein n=1 Tax=Hydnum rufescens UP504 TaxID=1448309 RepID=A0A9P6AYQ2_9AGAM|nr:hypothetical protein BS47DRAFT_1343244 [Hydnum rufescens UP504]